MVVGDGKAPAVPGAVDLEEEADLLPPDVEIDPATRPSPDDLVSRRGQTPLPAQHGDIELTEGMDPVTDRLDDPVDERAPGERPFTPCTGTPFT